MSAAIYGIKKWCTLSPEKITEVINKIKNGFLYNGQKFYDEVEKMNGWADPTPDCDSVMIWNGDDAGPISENDQNTGLFVHFDETAQKYDFAVTYYME